MRRLILVTFVALAVAAPAAAMIPRDDPDLAPAAAVTAVLGAVPSPAPAPRRPRSGNAWAGFGAPITDASTHTLNVIVAGGWLAVHFKLAGPVVAGNPLSDGPSMVSLDCASVAGWPTHMVPWSGDFNDDGSFYIPSEKEYAFGFLTYPDEVGDCATLAVTLLDGSTHTAAFALIAPPVG